MHIAIEALTCPSSNISDSDIVIYIYGIVTRFSLGLPLLYGLMYFVMIFYTHVYHM